MQRLSADDPRRVGEYRLLARLGEGGMGRVYLARSARGRTVAVKCVRADLAQQPDFRRRFAQEITAARRVGDAWTAPVLDADTEAATPWVATGYIAGPSLTEVVEEQYGPLPARSVSALASGLVEALRAIHGAGLVHRDLKPSNILVAIDGPRVIDFGIARALDGTLHSGSVHTRTGAIVGSPGFMSPEQVRGLRVTAASDVFCLGAVLAYAATGRQPFGTMDSGVHALLFRIAEEEPELGELSGPLRELVADCLAKRPEDRPGLDTLAERTRGELAGTWLPGEVLAQLGRHAVRLLDSEEPESESREDADGPRRAADAERSERPADADRPEQPDHSEWPGSSGSSGRRADPGGSVDGAHTGAEAAADAATSTAAPPRPSTPPPQPAQPAATPPRGEYGPPASAAHSAYAQPWGTGPPPSGVGPVPGPAGSGPPGPGPGPNTPPPAGSSSLTPKSPRVFGNVLAAGLGVAVLWGVGRLALGFSVYSDLESPRPGSGDSVQLAVTGYDAMHLCAEALELALVGLWLTLIVSWCLWFWRVRMNAEALAPGRVRYSTFMALGSWFIPVCNFFMPKQVMKDIWLVSVPPESIRPPIPQLYGPGVPYRPGVPLGLVHNWWWLWLLSFCMTPAMAESWYDHISITGARQTLALELCTDFLGMVTCLVTCLMVLRLTSLQDDRIAERA